MSRNIALTSVAGTLRARGFDEHHIYGELLAHPERRGLPESECRGIARSVVRYPAGTPREAPPSFDDVARRYGLTREDFDAAGCEFRGDRIVYPVALADGTVARKFKGTWRDVDGKRKSWGEKDSGFQRGLFLAREDTLSACEGATLVLAEGEEKALAATLAGRCAVSPANGCKGLGRETAKMVADARPARVVIAFDADEAGREGAAKSARLLHEAGVFDVRIVQWPDDAESGRDVNDVLVESGVDGVQELLDGAGSHQQPVFSHQHPGMLHSSSSSSSSSSSGTSTTNHGVAETRSGHGEISGDADASSSSICSTTTTTTTSASVDAQTGDSPTACRAGARRSRESALSSSFIPHPSSFALNTITAAALAKMKFPPLAWIVDGLLPPGIGLLCADPKVGKSRLATRIAMHVAQGTPMWGRATRGGDCLFVAMEEPLEALQDRMLRLQPGGDFPERLSLLAFDFPSITDGGLQALDAWARKVEQPRLIVLDTWAHVRGEDRSRADAYTRDVQALKPLQQWCAKWPQMSLLLIHHYRKGDGAHWTHKSNGSVGMIGGADVVLGMSREGPGRAKLQGIGRRVMEFAWMLRSDDVSWELEGDAQEAEKSEGLGEFQQEVLAYLQECGPAGPTQIASSLDSSPGNVARALRVLQQREIATVDGGKWSALCSAA